jgi:hypothetical protein
MVFKAWNLLHMLLLSDSAIYKWLKTPEPTLKNTLKDFFIFHSVYKSRFYSQKYLKNCFKIYKGCFKTLLFFLYNQYSVLQNVNMMYVHLDTGSTSENNCPRNCVHTVYLRTKTRGTLHNRVHGSTIFPLFWYWVSLAQRVLRPNPNSKYGRWKGTFFDLKGYGTFLAFVLLLEFCLCTKTQISTYISIPL